MAPAKPPESPSYPYHPLPPDHHHQQQPHTINNQFYVVLPFCLSDTICRRWRSRIICAASLFLLAVAIFFLWPSDPTLKVVRVRLDRFQVRSKPSISLDIALGLTVKVRNPDLFSMDYQSVKVSIGYRGKQLGFVTSDHGHVKALGSSYVNATLDLNGIQILSDVFFLIEDLARGSVPLDTVSEIRGTLGFFFIQLPLKLFMLPISDAASANNHDTCFRTSLKIFGVSYLWIPSLVRKYHVRFMSTHRIRQSCIRIAPQSD